MKFSIPPLPYPKDALAPHIGRETVELHYEKHHKGYLEKLRKLIDGKPEAHASLEELIRTQQQGEIFNNAAQVWNHNFYWRSMSPTAAASRPAAAHSDRRVVRLGRCVPQRFAEAAIAEFGSGWAWLVQDAQRRLSCATAPMQRIRSSAGSSRS